MSDEEMNVETYENLKMRNYRPLRVRACVAVSFFLLGVLEERRFLSLLSLHWPIAEVGGLGVILSTVLYAPGSGVYPAITVIVSLLVDYSHSNKLTSNCAKGNEEPETTAGVLPGSFHSEYFCRT